MAYNRIIPLGGGTDLLPDDNVWTGTNLFSNNISTTFEAQADNDIPNLKTVKNIANGGYRPKSPVKVVSHTNIVFLAGLDPITNSNGQVVNIIAGDNVCAAAQTFQIQNARYVVSSGAWTLAPDCQSGSDQRNTIFTETSTNDTYVQTADPAIVNVNFLVFVINTHNSQYAGDGVTIQINPVGNIISVKGLGISDAQVSTTAAINLNKLGLISDFVSGAGTLLVTDTLIEAIDKLDGNIGLKAPILDPVFTNMIAVQASTNQIYLGSGFTMAISTIGPLIADRIFTLPDANCNPIVPLNVPVPNEFLTNINGLGVQFTAQPAFSNLSGIASPTQGGTGLSSYVLGNIIYGSGVNTLAALAPNTSITKKYLSQIGDGVNGGAPVWDTVIDSSTSVQGIVNQIFVNGTTGIPLTGAVILTLPQNIHEGAYVTFTQINTLKGVFGNTTAFPKGSVFSLITNSPRMSTWGSWTMEDGATVNSGGRGLTMGIDLGASVSWLYSRNCTTFGFGPFKMKLSLNDDLILTDLGYCGIGIKEALKAKLHVSGHLQFATGEQGYARFDNSDFTTGVGGSGVTIGYDNSTACAFLWASVLDTPGAIPLNVNNVTFTSSSTFGIGTRGAQSKLHVAGVASVLPTYAEAICQIDTGDPVTGLGGLGIAFGTTTHPYIESVSSLGVHPNYSLLTINSILYVEKAITALPESVAGTVCIGTENRATNLFNSVHNAILTLNGWGSSYGGLSSILNIEAQSDVVQGYNGAGLGIGVDFGLNEVWMFPRTVGNFVTTQALLPMNISNELFISSTGVGIGGRVQTGGGANVLFIASNATIPTVNPIGGGLIYINAAGDLYAMGTTGAAKKLN